MFECFYCCYRTGTWKQLTRHTFECHSSVPGFSFQCGLRSCVRTFSNYSALQSHIARNHDAGDIPDMAYFGCHTESPLSEMTADLNPEDAGEGEEYMEQSPPRLARVNRLAKAAANFLLVLKEQHRLTQVSINFLVEQVNFIVYGVVDNIKKVVLSKLSNEDIDLTILESCFENVSPFKGLETEHKQTKFYKENFNLVVSCVRYPLAMCIPNFIEF